MLSNVGKAGSFTLPVANIAEFHRLNTEIQEIEKVTKVKVKDITAAIREQISRKASLEAEVETLQSVSRMWFETALEFKPRLSEALVAYAAGEKERKRKEEEEAFERQIKEEAEAQEKKRLDALRKSGNGKRKRRHLR